MRIHEIIKESVHRVRYDFHRIPDTNTFVATADGKEIGRFEGKSKFDSGAAQDAAKKCIVNHRTSISLEAEKEKEYQYQYVKPLTDNEKKWLQMHRRLFINRHPGTDSEYDTYNRYADVVRKSISRAIKPEEHPLAREYLATL